MFGCWRRRVFDTAVFKAELKEVLRTAGIEGTPVLLHLEECHLATDPGEAACTTLGDDVTLPVGAVIRCRLIRHVDWSMECAACLQVCWRC